MDEYTEKTVKVKCTSCNGIGYIWYERESDPPYRDSCHYCGGRTIDRTIKKGSGYQYLKLRVKNQSSCSECNRTGKKSFRVTGYELRGHFPWSTGTYC